MALLDPVYAVGDGHGRFPVRDQYDGLFVLLIPEGLEDDALVDAVDIACWLVEQYEPASKSFWSSPSKLYIQEKRYLVS